MTLRRRLVLAQAPLAFALAVVGVVSGLVTTRLAESSRMILADNYRSVLAAQRMKESLERMDSYAVFMLAGHPEGAEAGIARNRALFENELSVQEGNITEPGETELTARLRSSWTDYARSLAAYQALGDQGRRDATYFSTLEPSFTRVRHLADEILGMNQDAMVHKSVHVEDRAHRFEQIMVVAVVLALGLGLFASTWLTTRMLRPLGVVSAAVRRFADGDLRARASIQGHDEIVDVAREFNRMADHLERFRQSSLGELLQAQQAAQAAIDGLPDPVLLLDGKGQLQGANSAAARLLGIEPGGATSGSLFGRGSGGACRGGQVAGPRPRWSRRLCTEGLRGRGSRRRDARRGANLSSTRDAHLRRGWGGHGGCDRASGRHAAVSVRRAQEQPGRHGRARVPHAADVAADGTAPVHRAGRRAADPETGRPAVRRQRRIASACRSSSTSC